MPRICLNICTGILRYIPSTCSFLKSHLMPFVNKIMTVFLTILLYGLNPKICQGCTEFCLPGLRSPCKKLKSTIVLSFFIRGGTSSFSLLERTDNNSRASSRMSVVLLTVALLVLSSGQSSSEGMRK